MWIDVCADICLQNNSLCVRNHKLVEMANAINKPVLIIGFV